MFTEAQLLPISALQHLLYCERQCALIHVENLWLDNRYTAEGAVLHRAAHSGQAEQRRELRTLQALPVRSLALGLFGIADVVRVTPGEPPMPVEYKRGRPKKNPCDRVQLCAQALCLEEMLGVAIPHADLFYGKIRRHVRVELDPALRQLTRETAARLHRLVAEGRTPPAEPGPKCRRCSLRPLCLPELSTRAGSVADYIAQALAEP
ncbi:MAG: CRISPR-associated protein Cas4 [Isosphaeraceae bacterium]|nr:MAG: CRISPR-associated protein Cas4 [Isosphaeraceae bacterium]